MPYSNDARLTDAVDDMDTASLSNILHIPVLGSTKGVNIRLELTLKNALCHARDILFFYNILLYYYWRWNTTN